MIIEDENELGWRFHPYDDDSDSDPDNGYYTFRFGGPLYGIVEKAGQDGHFSCHICLEETDEPVTDIAVHTSLDIAKAQIVPMLRALLATWQERLEAMAEQAG